MLKGWISGFFTGNGEIKFMHSVADENQIKILDLRKGKLILTDKKVSKTKKQNKNYAARVVCGSSYRYICGTVSGDGGYTWGGTSCNWFFEGIICYDVVDELFDGGDSGGWVDPFGVGGGGSPEPIICGLGYYLDDYGNCLPIPPTPCETALLSRDVYNTTNGQQELGGAPIPIELSGGWELNTTLDTSEMTLTEDSTGFNSAVYQKKVNGVYQYMYVTEGTNPVSIKDWINNMNQLSGKSPQYETSVTNAEILHKLVGNNQLYFTGHSLGGGLASANSLATGRTAFTYNAVGLSDNTRDLYNNGFNPQINATVVKGEIIDRIQSTYGLKAEDSDEITYIAEESGYWQDFFNERSPALSTYKSIRLHAINTIIDILDCE